MKNVILKKHPKDSAAARAVMLAKNLSTILDTIPIWYEGWVLDEIYSKFEKICNATDNNAPGLKRKKLIRNYEMIGDDLEYSGLEGSINLISLALYQSINEHEKEAWPTLVDAAWLAGFTGKSMQAVFIDIPEFKSIEASARAENRHSKSIKTQAKLAIKECWEDWTRLAKSDPQAAQALYKNKTALAFDMLSKFPVIAGSKKQDINVIMGWIRKWENPTK